MGSGKNTQPPNERANMKTLAKTLAVIVAVVGVATAQEKAAEQKSTPRLVYPSHGQV
jgi:hypothetical protein